MTLILHILAQIRSKVDKTQLFKRLGKKDVTEIVNGELKLL